MEKDSPEDVVLDAFERLLRNEKRILLYNAPRDLGALKKLTDWQILQLAEALSLPEAVERVRRKTFNELDRSERVRLLQLELVSYDHQRYTGQKITKPGYWSELMQQYLKKELTLVS